MHDIWIDQEILYDGRQLRSRWIEETGGASGDAIATFIGPANVPIEHMVDLEDVAQNAPIFSQRMLHIIIEHPDTPLALAVARQRLLVAIAADLLRDETSTTSITRRGDDIFEGDRKLSVSIATSSPRSALIHFALNISSEGTPVPTKGLADYGLDPKAIGRTISQRYVEEIASMEHAEDKVRMVD